MSTQLELAKTKEAAIKQSTPLLQQANALQISNPATYMVADKLRATVKAARKTWKDRLELVRKPAYDALQAIYAFINEIDNPMEIAETVLTDKMKEYKREEFRKDQELKAEQLRLQREEEAAQRRLEAAKSKPASIMLGKAVERIQEQRNVAMSTTIESTVANNSTTRPIKRWGISSFKELIDAVSRGDIPEDVLSVNVKVMDDYWRGDDDDKSMMRTWPGIKIVEDVQIVSKRGK